MNVAIHEKRGEIREPAEGPVLVNFSNPQPMEILGQLVDVSPSGFRMAHANQSLQSGQLVGFSHGLAIGTARVMWNRILDHRVETGFRIVTTR